MKYLPIFLVCAFLVASIAYGVGGKLTPGGGTLLTPGTVQRVGTAIQPATTGDTLGTWALPWVSGFFTSFTASTTDAGTLTQGGGIFASSTSNAIATSTASDFDVENYISYTPNVSSVILKLPASSTLSAMIPKTGDTRRVILENATTTPGITLTLSVTGVAGMSISNATSSLTIPPGSFGILDFYRKLNTDIFVIFNLAN
jgi:hypothetical protein